MALENTISTAYGIDANYWRIIALHTDYVNSKTHAVMACYVDKKTRDKGASHVTTTQFALDGAIEDRAVAYDAIKCIEPEFSGRLDFRKSKDV